MAMFTFPKWRDWMQEWANVHRTDFVELQFKASAEPGSAVATEFSTTEVIAVFSFWESALADFDVMDISTKEWIANEWMIALDDENFELEFSRFLAIAGFAPVLSDAQVREIEQRLADVDEATITPEELRARIDKLL